MDQDNRGSIDWDELKNRLAQEIGEFAGPDARSDVPGALDVMPGWWEWQWYRSKPEEERQPPGLTSADFAEAYRNDLPLSQRLIPGVAPVEQSTAGG